MECDESLQQILFFSITSLNINAYSIAGTVLELYWKKFVFYGRLKTLEQLHFTDVIVGLTFVAASRELRFQFITLNELPYSD